MPGWRPTLLLLAAALWPGGEAAAAPEWSARIRAAPELHRLREESPFAPAADLIGAGGERARGEVEVRVRADVLRAVVAGRSTARRDEVPANEVLLLELVAEPELWGQHLALGKKVTSWDVGFGFRPLDLVQHEDRRAFRAFSPEGVPQVAWETFGEDRALTLVYANPLRGRARSSRDDEAVALRLYHHLGALDVHLVARWSARSALESGVAFALVVGDAVELHGSFRHAMRQERPVNPLAGSEGSPLASGPPLAWEVGRDRFAALAGFTASPGLGVSILGEAWYDPLASSAAEWRAMGELARRQHALLDEPGVPRDAVLGNLAWGARFFDRPSLLRQNVLLRVSHRGERLEPAIDLLYTPEDGGLVATASVSWQGERSRLDLGVRAFGGRPGAAYRLLPEEVLGYASWELAF